MKRPEHFDYRPMRQQPVASDAEVAAMHAKLARRGWGSRKVTIALQWREPRLDKINDTYTIKDGTERYTVLAERGSRDSPWRYLAFKGKSVLGPPVASGDEAKAMCQRDADSATGESGK